VKAAGKSSTAKADLLRGLSASSPGTTESALTPKFLTTWRTNMNTTTTESKRVKRRTFKEVAAAAYERGFAEGVDLATKNAGEEVDTLVSSNLELRATVITLQTKLANVSLRKLAWSRITVLFGGKP
jgi:hypothetical protein